MSKARNPVTFSTHFKVNTEKLDSLGAFDPTLAIDTKLFIDPLLFPKSSHPEIHESGVVQYRQHFETIIKFLTLTQKNEDVSWKSARGLLEFHELRGTCLGYGSNSITGSGFGPELTERVLVVGKEIVDLGVRDPDLFPAMALFEEGIGPDRISDMATNIIRKALAAFNHRILKELGLTGERFDINGIDARLMANPFQNRRTPIILVPRDILRKLPIARDWDEVADAAHKIDAIRKRINTHIGEIWALKTRRNKSNLRAQALANREAFETLLDAIHGVPPKFYDITNDPDGLFQWARKGPEYARRFPITFKPPIRTNSIEGVYEIVKTIVTQFRQLIENNGLNRELYQKNGKPRHESSAQRLFFATAHSHCKANNLDISPEVDTGSGKIDFKVSAGFDSRVLVEIKLSTSSRVVSGYRTQLETYKAAEQTTRAIYLVMNVGGLGSKEKRLTDERNSAQKRGEPLSDLQIIDGIIKPTASKR